MSSAGAGTPSVTEPIRWLEVAVEAHLEAVEAVSEILDRVGYNGIAVEVPLDPSAPHVVKAYLVYDRTARIKVRRVKEAIGHLRAFGLGPVGEVALRRIADEDWLETWRAQFSPIRIGPFLVRPSWAASPAAAASAPRDAVAPPTGDASAAPSPGASEPEAAALTEIVLDPGMAFGTGLHPTTHQCLEAVGRLGLAGRSVLDVGTGSGILAIAAAKRGARPVVGVDVDPLAVRAATENALRNDARVEVREGSTADVEGAFDIVLANLVADVLASIAAELRSRLLPGGVLVAAGIVREKAEPTAQALAAAGLAVAERDDRDDWVSLTLR